MAVVNIMEEIVPMIMDAHWQDLNLPCSCQMCKDDILALTLNSVPSRYVAKDRGRLFVKATYMDDQLYADVLKELAKASLIVANNPSHELHANPITK